MADAATISHQLMQQLGLRVPPIVVHFTDEAPAGARRVEERAPAGCAYWRRAAEGEVLATVADDHTGCPIGSYTHGVQMTPALESELHKMLGVMAQLSYVAMEEVPSIPRRSAPLRTVVYAPLARAPKLDAETVVLVRATPRQAMLLAEAAQSAGAGDSGAPGLRPACSTVPRVTASGKAAASFGCIGNRVYTGIPDDEGWYALPAPSLAKVVERLAVVAHANVELEKFHRARL